MEPQTNGANSQVNPEMNSSNLKRKIFITGSSDGLGLLTAKSLIEKGYSVVLHARNENRKQDLIQQLPQAETVVIGDLSDQQATVNLAGQLNKLGPFQSVIHNAGIYNASSLDILRVNLLAPYILTCLMDQPERLIYISSDMHYQGHPKLKEIAEGTGNDFSYSDSKFGILLLMKAVSQKWEKTYCNAVDPGWVPTKMGGSGAPDNLEEGYHTQIWLSTGTDENTRKSNRYFYHLKEHRYNKRADDKTLQQQFLDACKTATGINFIP